MKWQTKEEVQTVTNEKEALECSIEHWRQVSKSTFDKFEEARQNKLTNFNYTFCGLCQFHDNDCRNCILDKSEDGCKEAGSTYGVMIDAFWKAHDSGNEKDKLQWQITAKNMYLQLLGLKEPELKHGDKILWDGDVPVYLELISGWKTRDRFLLFDDGSYFKNEEIEEELANANYTITENIFEESK